jgi:REP element-mobilizing transposase RayT
MARPLRIEFPGAVYHVTSRGDRREPIFEDDQDRLMFLDIVAQALSRFDGQMLAYCLMGNHYHFVLHTRKANLSSLMRHINGVYTQAFNRRHDKIGHLFQGRFKAILVDRDAYLLEVCRYVELNPVRAGTTRKPHTWPWSSYRAHSGVEPAPEWLDTDGLHSCVLGRAVRSASERRRAGQAYARLVASASNVRLWDDALRQQIYLGDENFVERMQALADPRNSTDRDVPRVQRSNVRTLKHWMSACRTREDALYRAHTESGISMTQIANEIGLSISRVSRLIKQEENERAKGKA